MKKLRTLFCLTVIGLCLPGIVISAKHLPPDNSELVGKKYAGWNGVLRVRAFEGWTGSDAASGWIRRCAAAFEKSHPGVFIEIKSSGPDRLLSADGTLLPDMILFPPGLLTSPAGLAPLDALPVRAELMGAGQGFAAPVALGGYGWAVNGSASGTAVPSDEPWRRWSLAAKDGPRLPDKTESAPREIDIGLPASSDAAPPLTRFMNGELGAVAVTQRELQRLTRLSDQGRGPDWTFAPGGSYTDQVLYISALSGGERERLSREFILHLLTPECQRQLTRAGLFSVLDVPAGYTRGSAMSMMEEALLRQGLTAPPAFNIFPEP